MINAQILLEKLSLKLRHATDKQRANAAVALLLSLSGTNFEVLLVRRAKNPSDPWSGQMALPGGKQESNDDTLKATVIRETMEEISVDISGSRFLGVLNVVQSVPKHDFLILPFVIQLEKKPSITLNLGELESYMWVPFEKIAKSRGKTTEPGVGEVSAFLLENAVVWGITYRVLKNFSEMLEALKKG